MDIGSTNFPRTDALDYIADRANETQQVTFRHQAFLANLAQTIRELQWAPHVWSDTQRTELSELTQELTAVIGVDLLTEVVGDATVFVAANPTNWDARDLAKVQNAALKLSRAASDAIARREFDEEPWKK